MAQPSRISTPQEMGAASVGVWLVSDVVATASGLPGAPIALAICALLAASEVGRSPRSLVTAVALVGTLFTSATGTNAVASHVVTRAQAQTESEPRPTRTPVIKPWFRGFPWHMAVKQ